MSVPFWQGNTLIIGESNSGVTSLAYSAMDHSCDKKIKYYGRKTYDNPIFVVRSCVKDEGYDNEEIINIYDLDVLLNKLETSVVFDKKNSKPKRIIIDCNKPEILTNEVLLNLVTYSQNCRFVITCNIPSLDEQSENFNEQKEIFSDLWGSLCWLFDNIIVTTLPKWFAEMFWYTSPGFLPRISSVSNALEFQTKLNEYHKNEMALFFYRSTPRTRKLYKTGWPLDFLITIPSLMKRMHQSKKFYCF
jgi:hypothetical protein